MIALRYLFALPILLVASHGQVFAQSSTDARVDKLEETVRVLERRVATLEGQVHQRNAAPAIPPDKANWRRIQKGLSESDVERLLGPPTKVEALGPMTTWYYGSSGAAVYFDGGAVNGWQEP